MPNELEGPPLGTGRLGEYVNRGGPCAAVVARI
jgi:hypothetical protein